jgi:RNA polymerase sigma factor (sigma-70 family)
MSNQELEACIRGCVRGNAKSQERLYRYLYGTMMAVCLRYTKNHEQAEDILQEGFIKVFDKVHRFNFDGSFEGWVRRIMVNTAIDFFRKKKTDFTVLGENDSIENYADVAEEEEEHDENYDFTPDDILKAMQQLTPAYRAIFNLYVFENMTHVEIAEQLGISVGTSKSNYAKAKRNLKKILTNRFSREND